MYYLNETKRKLKNEVKIKRCTKRKLNYWMIKDMNRIKKRRKKSLGLVIDSILKILQTKFLYSIKVKKIASIFKCLGLVYIFKTKLR